jgi:ATP-dependent Lon protease
MTLFVAAYTRSAEAAAQEIVQTSERKIAEVHRREAQELSRLDKLIAVAREMAVEVKERATEMVRNVAERVDSFMGRGKEEEQARPSTLSVEERLEQKLSGLDKKLSAQESLEDRLAGFEKRMETQVKMQQEQQEKELSKQQQLEISRGRGGHSL